MKKLMAILMTLCLAIGMVSIATSSVAAASYVTIFFTDLDYATGYVTVNGTTYEHYRSDQPGQEGFTYGTDYWFGYITSDMEDAGEEEIVLSTLAEMNAASGTIMVTSGGYIAITVYVADYVEDSTVRVLAYPTAETFGATGTGTDGNTYTYYDEETGIFNTSYIISQNSAGTYAVDCDGSTEQITISLDEYHLYNDGILYEFYSNDYFDVTRVYYDDYTNLTDYSDYNYATGTLIVYYHSDIYFEVSIDEENIDSTNPDTYTVNLTLTDADGESTTEELEPVYETDYVTINGEEVSLTRVYCVPDFYSEAVSISITGIVDLTISMIPEFLEELMSSIESGSIDSVVSSYTFMGMDFSGIVEFFQKILKLISNMLAAFGLDIDLTSLFS